MAKLAHKVQQGRESAKFIAALVEHIRLVHVAQMAAQRLEDLRWDVEQAAARRGRDAPEPPEVAALPDDTEFGLALFNGTVRDKLLRQAHERMRTVAQGDD